MLAHTLPIPTRVEYVDAVLCLDGFPLDTMAAEQGTPLYAMSQAAILDRIARISKALSRSPRHLVCYAVKANPTRAIIEIFARASMGADVISGGELFRALRAGIPPDRIVFSGVGKTNRELAMAVDAGILGIQVESFGEIAALAEMASSRSNAIEIGLRINPEVQTNTKPGISTGHPGSKFGFGWLDATEAIAAVHSSVNLRLAGLSMHVGSQITDMSVFASAASKIATLARELLVSGKPIQYIDFGGGLGIDYTGKSGSQIEAWAKSIQESVKGLPVLLIVEPGRSLVAEAGVILTKVIVTKSVTGSPIVVIDAGMNDLIRPMLYGSYHRILPVVDSLDRPLVACTIVGPICESTDTFATSREMRLPQPGDVLAILDTGAYGSSMASNYNSRPKPAEVLVTSDQRVMVMRERETYEDLVRREYELE